MSRDLSPNDPRNQRGGNPDPREIEEAIREDRQISQASSGQLPRPVERPNETRRPPVHFVAGHAVLYEGEHGYRLTATQIRAITELGKFRLIAAYDLARHTYQGQRELAQSDVGYLMSRGLVERGVFDGPEATPRELLALTRRGHRLLRANMLVPRNQAVYHGFVRPKEANHDADLYRLYQKEAKRIRSEGGTNLRVILDYELKRKINRDIAHFGIETKPEIAERYGLRVVDNKIPIPDLRLEYETRHGEMAMVDLELVTEHYRGRKLAEKVRAGFRLFAPHVETDHLRILDQQGLTAEILSL